MTHSFKLIGQGFDTVQLSFQTRIPDQLAYEITGAQQVAKQTRKPEPVSIGPGHVRGEVLRHGGGGGDAIFSTGELGQMWFLKTDQKGDKWGAMIKVRSLALLCHGFEDALSHVWEHANGMGLDVTGYSLGRIDYRFDFLTDRSFAPIDTCVLRHNRTVVRPYEVVDRQHPNWDWSDDPDVQRVLRGKRIETLMIGTIGGGMQIVIYDKRSELTITRNHVVLERYGLDLADPSWGLWRVEVRFAGDVLKRRLNVRDLRALSANLCAMLTRAITRIRYVEPGQDHLPSREKVLHPLWARVTDAIQNATCQQPSQFAPERAEYLIRKERERSLKANIAGCALGLAAMRETTAADIAAVAPNLASKAVTDALAADPMKIDRIARRNW